MVEILKITDRREKVERFEELAQYIQVDEPKKSIVLSLLSDFVYYEKKINDLRQFPLYIVNKNNPLQQKKLPAFNMLKDYQAQKNDIAVKILRTLIGENIEEGLADKLEKLFNE